MNSRRQLSVVPGGNTYDLDDLVAGRTRFRQNRFAGTPVDSISPLTPSELLARHLNPHPTENVDWMDNGNCVGLDPEVMFPEECNTYANARRVCFGCEVREECLSFAVRHNEKYGMWGGMTPRERRDERARRRAAKAVSA